MKDHQALNQQAFIKPVVVKSGIWTKETPQANRALIPDFLVPFFRAIAIAACVVLICWASQFHWRVDVVLGALTFVGVFVYYTSAEVNFNRLIYELEMATGRDLNKDGVIGDPAKQPEADPPVFVDKGKASWSERDKIKEELEPRVNKTAGSTRPNRDLANDLCEFLIEGQNRGYAFTKWQGRTLNTNKKVTRPYWDKLKAILLAGDLLVKGPKNTTVLADDLDIDDAVRAIRHPGI